MVDLVLTVRNGRDEACRSKYYRQTNCFLCFAIFRRNYRGKMRWWSLIGNVRVSTSHVWELERSHGTCRIESRTCFAMFMLPDAPYIT